MDDLPAGRRTDRGEPLNLGARLPPRTKTMRQIERDLDLRGQESAPNAISL